MANTFETRGRNSDENEIIPNIFGFQSAGKKYINQNYKRIGSILGIVGADLGSIKKQANQEKKLPDVQGAITLDQINFYREHYGFNSISQSDYENIESDSNVVGEVVQPLTAEQFERNKKLSGWPASYELAKIAKSQNIDLSILSREEYADFAIQNRLMIDDNQLRMSSWQRMCESPEEINQKLQEMRSLINPEAESDFDRFTNEMIQKAGEDNRSIDNEIAVRQGTKNSDHWLFFSINEGANIGDEQVFKSYASLKDLNLLTPDKFTNFMQALRDAGYNGDIKIFQDLMSQGLRLNDQIVMHGASEADAELGLSIADQFFGDSLSDTSLGVDQKNQETGKYNSYSQVLAQKIKDSVQGEISNSEQQSQSTNEVNNTSNLEIESLQSELSRLITEAANKLEIEKGQENNKEYSGRLDREKIERFTENARQAIQDYQKFAGEHSSPFDNSNAQIQEEYRKLEKIAWNSLYNLAHALDGEIATLPQDRDIQLSHPEGVDIRQYLETRGYRFDENGDITHINDNGFEIELNRAIKTDSLIKSRRPSHIVYDKSIYLDNDMNYQGYLVRGLNQQTPDFIVGVLDKNNLEPIIVDETGQSTVTTTEAKQDPWSIESRGDTEFEKIFAGNLSRNKDTQGNNEIPDPWVEKAVIEEPPIIPVFPIPSGDNSDLQSEGAYPLGEEGLETTPQVSLDDLRLAYARAEEAWNRKRGDLKLENAFESAREDYNTELERVLKLQVAEGQEANIHQIFKDEFIALRDSRVVQSKELQGKWEKRLNPIKEEFVNFVIKHKKIISRLNLAAGVAGGALALTGVGIPLAGGLAVARRIVSATLLGVSTGEGIRSLGEDADINSFWGKIKFQAVIPKLVQESLASSEDEFKQVSGDVLKERLGTLEAYYRLNGGRFINDNQQQAYEKVLIELARRVQENVIYVENNKDTLQSDWQEQKPQELTDVEIKNLADENLSKRNIIAKSIPFSRNREIERQYDLAYEKDINWEKLNPERYTSELLNTISDKRIVELDKFRKNRKTATIAGLGVGLLAGGAVHLSDEFNKPDSVELTDGSDSTAGDPTPEVGGTGSGPGEASAPEAGAVATPEVKPTPSPEIPPTGASAEEALRQAQALAQDVSSLDSAETIWGEIAKQLGTGASEAQIQEAVEKYLGSIKGQDTIFKLAQQTEDGRALLSQWGIDNAGEMSGLSKERLYEVSKYLGEGKLDGLTELSLDNLDALDPAVATTPSSAGAPTIEPGSTERPAPPAGPEVTGAEPPSPPAAETPVTPQSTELPPVASTEFTRGVSEALGATNLTETQLQEVIYSFATSEQGSTELYNQIISNEEGARFLSGFGVNNAADFANLRPDEVYEIAQTVGVENLDKLLGFELNEIILSKFEDAPDMVELARGTRPLDVVNQYISSEIGNLPYDSTLGQQVLNTYLDTADGKQWLYDAIVNNPDVDNQNIQLFREYLRFKDIKSPEDFVSKFNWAEFSGNKNIPTSAFWNQTRLPNGVDKLQPLSTLLKPSRMLGIKDAVRQVLTRQ